MRACTLLGLEIDFLYSWKKTIENFVVSKKSVLIVMFSKGKTKQAKQNETKEKRKQVINQSNEKQKDFSLSTISSLKFWKQFRPLIKGMTI